MQYQPTIGAWQRQLNDNAIYAANRLDFVKSSDGRAVREYQSRRISAQDTTCCKEPTLDGRTVSEHQSCHISMQDTIGNKEPVLDFRCNPL